MSTQPAYDVLIVGGRAAGASVAQLLARQGRRVLVADRDEFPSDTMSTHFMSLAAVGALKRLGVLDDVLTAGFRRVTRQRTRVEGLLQEGGDVVGAVLQTTGGERREVRARVVIGADGKSSRVADWVGAEKYDEVPALRPAYYGYFHGIEPRPEATLEIFFGGDQIGFLFPMREGEDCIALEIQPEEFAEFRSQHDAVFEARVRRLPEMARRMQHALVEGKVIGFKGIDNYFRKPYGPGWALTGDAGYLKDPSTGLGIGDALEQAFTLAGALGAWFDGADWEGSLSAFHQKRDQIMKPLYDATLDFTRMRDIGAAEQNLLKAVLLSPATARTVAHAMVAQLPSLF